MLENADQGQAKEKKIFGMDVKDIAETVKMLMENKDQTKEVVGIFAPIIGEAIDLTLDTIGPEAYKGFTREEALVLLLADAKAVENIGNVTNNSVKK